MSSVGSPALLAVAGRPPFYAGHPYVGGSGRAAHLRVSFLRRLSLLGCLVSIPECSGQRHPQTLLAPEGLVVVPLVVVPAGFDDLAKPGGCGLGGTASLAHLVGHSMLHPIGKVLPLHWAQSALR